MFKQLRQDQSFDTQFYYSGQQGAFVQQVFEDFEFEPDYSDRLQSGNALSSMMTEISDNIQKIISAEKPKWILVQGDTLTAYCGAMLAFLNKIKIAHVEAGLRSHDIENPFPEEVFRKFIDGVSDLHFAPSEYAVENLKREGIDCNRIHLVGNTGEDASFWLLSRSHQLPDDVLDFMHKGKRSGRSVALLTMHRRENQKGLIASVFKTLENIVKRTELSIVYITHPHTSDRGVALHSGDHIKVSEPLRPRSFISVLKSSDIILTDSGGVQEEATYHSKAVIVLRHKTERVCIHNSAIGRILNLEKLEHDILELLDLSNTESNQPVRNKPTESVVAILKQTLIDHSG